MKIQVAGAFDADSIVQYNREKSKPKDTFTSYFPLWKKISGLETSTFDPVRIDRDSELLVVNLDQKTWDKVKTSLNQFSKTILVQFEAQRGWKVAYEKAGVFDAFINFDPNFKDHPGFQKMNIPYDPTIASSHRDKRGFSALIDQWHCSRKLFIETYLLEFFPPKKKCVMIATLNPGENYQIRKTFAEKWPDLIDVFGGGWPKSMKNYRGFISSKTALLKRYRYCLVVENQREPGYITEKLLDCITTGTVPIYWGAPDIHDYPGLEWVPTIENEESDLKAIINNDQLYLDCKRKMAQNRSIILNTFSTEHFTDLLANTICMVN